MQKFLNINKRISSKVEKFVKALDGVSLNIDKGEIYSL
ncbi:MAG: oligopeptide ABC transporter ATP-binding protein, partial [Aciduliprofundum sp.]